MVRIMRFLAAAAALWIGTGSAIAQSRSPFPPGYEAAYRAYLASLPPGTRQYGWLTKFDGVSSPPRPLQMKGKPVLYMFGCKNHACDTNNVNLFLFPDRKRVSAVVKLDGKQALVGTAGPQEIACVKALDASGGSATAC
jgi:hypothetical protein